MNYTFMLYIAIMQIALLANITIAKGAWNGVTMWLCTVSFCFRNSYIWIK
ncbi:hypothetical protein [Lysinibacillus capsici]